MMALTLQLRSRIKSNACSSLTLTHRFSTSNSGDSNSKSPFASYFSDVKDKLNNTQPRTSTSFSFAPSASNSNSTKVGSGSLDEIRKNLSQFRRPTSSGHPSSEPISFQEIYNRNVSDKSGQTAGSAGGKTSWDSIRARMQQLRPSSENKQGGGDPLPLSAFRNSLKSNPSDSAISSSSSVIGGTGGLPSAIFGKEMREKRSSATSAAAATEFVKMYSHAELGAKLRNLRPEGGGKERFSLAELNDRLKRLREMDDNESSSKLHGIEIRDLKESLMRLQVSEEEAAMKTSRQRIDILGHLGRIPSTMMDPPQEHLVERYFHPDNMSSAEKLKIELAKVRDEFKMSESDCGSARVQVAQLTTKIKHLSSVLHKKDKHSRKGLLAMVQRRKRLLRYLRSTDWDSYCFVISKLGLRDNPDIKA